MNEILLLPKAYAYSAASTSELFASVATTAQETLIDAMVRFLPIAIPVVIFMAFMWWVLRRFGVGR